MKFFFNPTHLLPLGTSIFYDSCAFRSSPLSSCFASRRRRRVEAAACCRFFSDHGEGSEAAPAEGGRRDGRARSCVRRRRRRCRRCPRRRAVVRDRSRPGRSRAGRPPFFPAVLHPKRADGSAHWEYPSVRPRPPLPPSDLNPCLLGRPPPAGAQRVWGPPIHSAARLAESHCPLDLNPLGKGRPSIGGGGLPIHSVRFAESRRVPPLPPLLSSLPPPADELRLLLRQLRPLRHPRGDAEGLCAH